MAKEKYPKERPPGYRFILRVSLLTGAYQKGLLSLWQRAASLPRP